MGLGAGGVFNARAAEAGGASNGRILEPHPTGASGERWGASSEIRGASTFPSRDEAHLAVERPTMSPEPVIVQGAGLASHQLHFRNDYIAQLWICISFYDPANCNAWGVWGTRGWWSIAPGQSVYVLNTPHPEAFFYAETATGYVWTHTAHYIYAPQTAFSSCLWNHRIGDRYLGMHRLGLYEGANTFGLR